MTERDIAEFKARIEAMTPDERRQLAVDICKAVDDLAENIVDNADAIWEANRPTLH